MEGEGVSSAEGVEAGGSAADMAEQNSEKQRMFISLQLKACLLTG
jgi:hypothetical protein